FSPLITRVSAPVRAAEPPQMLPRASRGQVCWNPVMAFNGPNDQYAVYAVGPTQPIIVPAAGHDPSTPVCWNPEGTGATQRWTAGNSYGIYVTASVPGVLESDNSLTLPYLYIPASGNQLALQYNCVYESPSMQCVKAVLVTGDAVAGADSYDIYRN